MRARRAPVRVIVRDAWYRYPGQRRYALRGASLEAGPGEIVGLVGPNGSGKTTLLMVAAGLLEPERGSALIGLPEGRTVRAREARGLIVYHPPAPIRMRGTVLQNIMAGPLLRGHGEDEARRLAMEAARSLGIESLLARPMRALSQGQAMLASIARLVAAGPRALLLDEPAASLDTRKRRLLAGLLARLAGEGRVIVLASHDTGLLREVHARIVEVVEGRTARLA